MISDAWNMTGSTPQLPWGTARDTWNAAGRLITTTNGTITVGFRYDGDGNRLARIVDGTLTTHTLDVGLSLPEVIAEHQSLSV